MMVANGDPLNRFITAVAWDGYANLSGVATRPSKWVWRDTEGADPVPAGRTGSSHRSAPHSAGPAESAHHAEELRPPSRLSCVDSMFQVFARVGPLRVRLFRPRRWNQRGSLAKRERVAMYFTLAWFDRYLKGAITAFTRGDESAQSADALARLTHTTSTAPPTAHRFGIGHWDPTTQKNMPYMIENDTVADHLSFLYSSSSALGICN